MANRLLKVPKAVYTPAVAPVPQQPPYCTRTPVYDGYSGGGKFGVAVIPPQQPTGVIPPGYSGTIDPYGYGSVIPYSPYRPVVRYVEKCTAGAAAKPAIPARTDYFENLGWNAGARSIAPVPDNGFFRCTLPPSPIGVQVGFTSRGITHTYTGMKHSLVARRDQFTIVESGATVFGPSALVANAQVEIQRTGGIVSYLVEDTVVYVSAVPSSGEAYAGATLYTTNDYVDSPSIGPVNNGLIYFDVELPGIVAGISETEEYTEVTTSSARFQFEALLERVGGVINFEAELPLLALAAAETDYNWMLSALPVPVLEATGSAPEEMPSSMVALIPPPVLSTDTRTGKSISFEADIPLAFIAAEENINRVDADISYRLILGADAPYLPANEADGSDGVYVQEEHVLQTALLLVAMDSLDVGSTSATLILVLELSAMDSLSVSDATSFGALVEMIAMEQVAVYSSTSAARRQALQYAVNALTGALSTYQGFDFQGFALGELGTYAWKSDGLYRLGAETDDGELISALVDFGATDFADAHTKGIDLAYVGVRTDGQCYLRVITDDGRERVYAALGNSNQRRAKLGQGISGRYWNLKLELVDASFATVDNVELEVGITQRRGFSRRS